MCLIHDHEVEEPGAEAPLPAGSVVDQSEHRRALKLWAQQGRFRVPPHVELRKQLANLEYETTEAGATRIAVPERSGHDDLVMSLGLACSQVMELEAPADGGEIVGAEEVWSDDDEDDYRAFGGFGRY